MGNAIAQGGEKGKNAFTATIAALAAMKDPIKQNAAGTALFGTQWEDVQAKVITAMSKGIGSIDNFAGATAKAGEALQNNVSAKATKTWREFKSSLEPLGEALLTLATQILPPIGAALSRIGEAFASMSPGVQTAIIIFGVLLAALGPLLVMFGSLATSIATLMPIFTAIGAFLTGTLAPAFLPIILAIGALIAAGVLLYQNWDVVKGEIIKIWDAIVGFVKPIIDDLVAFFNIQMAKIKGFWNKYGAEIMQIVDIIWTTIKGYFSTYLSVIVTVVKVGWELIKGVIKIAIEAIKFVIKTVLDIIIGIVSVFLSILKGDWDGAFAAVENTVHRIFNNIANFFSGLGKTFYNAGKGLIEQVVNGIKDTAGKVTDAISGVAGKVRNFLPFSPAKVGPLSDLDKLDFGGPITDSIKKAMPNVQKMMTGLVTLPGISAASNYLATSGGQPIYIEMDGRMVAKGVMTHAVDEVRRKTGVKFS